MREVEAALYANTHAQGIRIAATKRSTSFTTWNRTSARLATCSTAHPEIVRELAAKLDACRKDLGDRLTGAKGENVRPRGQVENPQALTEYNPDHPYMIAMYDIEPDE